MRAFLSNPDTERQYMEVTPEANPTRWTNAAIREARAILAETEPTVRIPYGSDTLRLDSGHGCAWILAESLAAILPVLDALAAQADHAYAVDVANDPRGIPVTRQHKR